MNRAQRRQLEREMKRRTLKHPVPGSITLHGGPMDGWVVKPGAPALAPDWRSKYLEEAARNGYEATRLQHPDEQRPSWEELGEPGRDHFRAIVREAKGDGRYVEGAERCDHCIKVLKLSASFVEGQHWHWVAA